MTHRWLCLFEVFTVCDAIQAENEAVQSMFVEVGGSEDANAELVDTTPRGVKPSTTMCQRAARPIFWTGIMYHAAALSI